MITLNNYGFSPESLEVCKGYKQITYKRERFYLLHCFVKEMSIHNHSGCADYFFLLGNQELGWP